MCTEQGFILISNDQGRCEHANISRLRVIWTCESRVNNLPLNISYYTILFIFVLLWRRINGFYVVSLPVLYAHMRAWVQFAVKTIRAQLNNEWEWDFRGHGVCGWRISSWTWGTTHYRRGQRMRNRPAGCGVWVGGCPSGGGGEHCRQNNDIKTERHPTPHWLPLPSAHDGLLCIIVYQHK